MKVKQSPLKVIDFLCIKNKFDFVAPTTEVVPAALFQSYDIDFDFAQTSVPPNFQIFVKVSINDIIDPVPGYKLFAEGVGIFSLNEAGLTAEEIINYKNYTALIITINHLRNYISNFTSYAPMGKYVLPSIDMQDLMLQKSKKQAPHVAKSKIKPKSK